MGRLARGVDTGQLAVLLTGWTVLSKEQRSALLFFEEEKTIHVLRQHVRRLFDDDGPNAKSQGAGGPESLYLLRHIDLVGHILVSYRGFRVRSEIAQHPEFLRELQKLSPSFMRGPAPRGSNLALQRSSPKSWEELQLLVIRLIEQHLFCFLNGTGKCPTPGSDIQFGEGCIGLLEEAFLPQIPSDQSFVPLIPLVPEKPVVACLSAAELDSGKSRRGRKKQRAPPKAASPQALQKSPVAQGGPLEVSNVPAEIQGLEIPGNETELLDTRQEAKLTTKPEVNAAMIESTSDQSEVASDISGQHSAEALDLAESEAMEQCCAERHVLAEEKVDEAPNDANDAYLKPGTCTEGQLKQPELQGNLSKEGISLSEISREEVAKALASSVSVENSSKGTEDAQIDALDDGNTSELTLSSSSTKSQLHALPMQSSSGQASSDEQQDGRTEPAADGSGTGDWTVVTSRKQQQKRATATARAWHNGKSWRPPRVEIPSFGRARSVEKCPSHDALSAWISSAESQSGVDVATVSLNAESGDVKEDNLTSFSLMDSLRLKLEAAMLELKAGHAETCASIIHGTLQLFGGLEPYLQSNNRAMSMSWHRLKQATAETNWRSHYVNGETLYLYHEGMGTSPLMMNTLRFLCNVARATHVLEVGTFTGLAALGLAEILPSHGSVVTLEQDPFLADFAKRQLGNSPHGEKIDILCGNALKSLKSLAAQRPGTQFELIFIDGGKSEYKEYLEIIYQGGLLAPHGIIVIDDVLWKGGVYEPFACESLKHPREGLTDLQSPWPAKLSDHEVASVMASLNDWIARDPRFESLILPVHNGITLIQLAGSAIAAAAMEYPPGLCKATGTGGSNAASDFSEFCLDPDSLMQPYRQHSAPACINSATAFARAPPLPPLSPALRSGGGRRASKADEPAYLDLVARNASEPSWVPMRQHVTRQTSAPAFLGSAQDPFASASGCSTPKHLWPSTPEGTPQLIPMLEPAFVVPMLP